MRKFPLKRSGKILLTVFLLVIALGAILRLEGPAWVESILKRQLQSPSGGIDIHWDSIEILPFSPGIRLGNLKIEKRFPNPPNAGTPPLRFRLTALSLELRGISLTSLLTKSVVRIRDVSLKNWAFSVRGNAMGNGLPSEKKGSTFPLRIERVGLLSGHLQWNAETAKPGGNSPRINAEVPRLEFSFPENPPRDMEDWMAHLLQGAIGPIQLEVKGMNSDIRVSRASVDLQREEILVENVTLTPRFPKYQFALNRGYQTDRIQVAIPVIRIKMNRSPSGESGNRDPLFRKILIQSPGLDIFRDRRLPRKQGARRRKPFPYQVLRRIPLNLSIPEIHIRDGVVSYSEHISGSPMPGELKFSRVSADISNLTFGILKSRTLQDTRCGIHCLLQESIPTELMFSMDPATPRFSFSGKVANIDLKTLNPLLIPLSFLRIDRGQMEGLKFRFQGDHRHIRGTTQVRYHDLKVSLLKRRTPSDRRGLATFLMNRLLLPRNPSEKSALRIAHVRLGRAPGRSFFNWLWRAVLDGMKRSVGI